MLKTLKVRAAAELNPHKGYLLQVFYENLQSHFMEIAKRDDLYKNPAHPYTQALLSAIPIPDPTVKKERILLEGDTPSPVDIPIRCL